MPARNGATVELESFERRGHGMKNVGMKNVGMKNVEIPVGNQSSALNQSRTRALMHSSKRRLYRGGRPNRLARVLNRLSATAHSAGIWPSRLATLEVAGRRTGRVISFPVVVADYEGDRYLVSMLGDEANWVRNVRAAGGVAMLRHGRREAVVLEEVDAGARAPILRRYLSCAPGARPHIPIDRDAPVAQFEQIAPHIPVFRITADRSKGGAPAG
jgi:deazaflavin-dependent oxidoreductase (nitroreductase family)